MLCDSFISTNPIDDYAATDGDIPKPSNVPKDVGTEFESDPVKHVEATDES